MNVLYCVCCSYVHEVWSWSIYVCDVYIYDVRFVMCVL